MNFLDSERFFLSGQLEEKLYWMLFTRGRGKGGSCSKQGVKRVSASKSGFNSPSIEDAG